MSAGPPVPPVASLGLELRTTGVGQLAIGAAGLAVALAAGDDPPARSIVPFVVVLVVVGALSHYATRWLRAPDPPPLPTGARVEERGLTRRRSAIGLALALVAVAAAAAIAPQLGAVLGGVVAAVGVIDLLNERWVRSREDATGRQLLRQLGGSPFAAGRRPLYTRPRNESTLAT